jgi:hypothetical protein
MLVKKLWSVAEMLVENVARQGYQDGVVGDWNQVRPGVRVCVGGVSLCEASEADFWENQKALMEVGNRICKPVAPDCDACPLKSGCRAYAEVSDSLVSLRIYKYP